MRGSFLSLLPLSTLTGLDDLNARFQHWLQQHYHRRLHRGTGECPLDRYLRSLSRIRHRRLAPQELDLVFYRTLSRKVHKDSTISIGGSFWEVPAPYIGQRIQIRHPEGKPQQLYLFEENQPVARLAGPSPWPTMPPWSLPSPPLCLARSRGGRLMITTFYPFSEVPFGKDLPPSELLSTPAFDELAHRLDSSTCATAAD